MTKQNIHLAVDVLLFTLIEKKLHVLLIKRKNNPFINEFAFPGGFVQEGELLKEAALRELKEETGVKNVQNMQLLDVYDAVNRDPRGRVISNAFIALADFSVMEHIKAASDAVITQWMPAEEVKALAFDHNKMLADALHLLSSLK